MNVDITNPAIPQQSQFSASYPNSSISEGRLSRLRNESLKPYFLLKIIFSVPEFLKQLESLDISFSVAGEDRLKRSHGQTLYEIFTLRTNKLPAKIPDAIVWPSEYIRLTITKTH